MPRATITRRKGKQCTLMCTMRRYRTHGSWPVDSAFRAVVQINRQGTNKRTQGSNRVQTNKCVPVCSIGPPWSQVVQVCSPSRIARWHTRNGDTRLSRALRIGLRWYDLQPTPRDGNCLFHAVTKALGRGGHTNLRRGVSALFTNGSTLLHALQRLPTERYEKHYGGDWRLNLLGTLNNLDKTSVQEYISNNRNQIKALRTNGQWDFDLMNDVIPLLALYCQHDIVCVSWQRTSQRSEYIHSVYFAQPKGEPPVDPVVVHHRQCHYTVALPTPIRG